MPAPTLTAKDVFDRAHELDSPIERKIYLDQVCADAPEIRQNVEELLKAYEDAGSLFLKSPVSLLDLTGPYRPGSDSSNPSSAQPITTDLQTTTIPDPPDSRIAEQIGPYKLIKELGEGGMGTVYLARQEHPIRREVALKIIKSNMNSANVIARFEVERQALTMMNHINIARVFDAGTTGNGLPYFAMEFINGKSITHFCNNKALTIRERLMLFVAVCEAVQHAHQKGIMHRDIKPSNVLVALTDEKPIAKIIDFGLAKAIEQPLTDHHDLSQAGNIIGTVRYMSPEQAEGGLRGIDVRTDIYSLGVMLYELLTGSIPLDDSRLGELLRKIKEDVPPKPSVRISGLGERLAKIATQRKVEPDRLVKMLRGELDWITLKALEKDRERRYGSALEFAKDVQSYLNDEPVQACPPTVSYRLGKFVRRNLIWVLALCVAFTALVIGSGELAVGLVQANKSKDEETKARLLAVEERNRAQEAEKRQQKALNMTWAGIRTQIRQRAKPGEMEAAILRNMLEGFQQLIQTQPDSSERERATSAEAEFHIANLFALVVAKGDAESHYRKAIQQYESLANEFANEPLYRTELGRCHFDLAYLFIDKDKPSEAEASFRKAIELLGTVTTDFPNEPAYWRELADAYNDLGVLLRTSNKPDEAKKALQEAIAIGEKVIADDPKTTSYRINLAASYHNLGNIVRDQGDATGSLDWYSKAIGLLNPINPRPADATLFLRNVCWDRANALGQLGKHDKAIQNWKSAIALDTGPEQNHLGLFLAASEMEVKLQAEAKPSAALLYEAATLNAKALSAAKEAEEDSLQRQYAKRALELLKHAKTAGWFSDPKKIQQLQEDKTFEILPPAEFKRFLESLQAGMKPSDRPEKG